LKEAAAFIHGWHRARVARTWKKAQARWREFDGANPFWRD
jgi:hypothetical protein